MKTKTDYKSKIKCILLYGGISEEAYRRVKEPVAESNRRALEHWSVLVSVFWMYCLLMSIKAADYALCRPAYTAALCVCIFSYLCCRILIPRVPRALPLCMCIFRLSLLGVGIGIALCQWDVRSLTMFTTAIIAPSIFIDNTVTSLIVHAIAVIGYIVLGKNVIVPEIYSWGLGNFILFSIFGLLIGNAINKERFERYFFADSAKELAEMQTKYAYYDQMTGLMNRRAYAERLQQLSEEAAQNVCIVMADINGLKAMNDTRGHEAGDELIIGAAQCLTAAFEKTGTVYRIGGDEFCVILNKSEETVQQCLNRLEEITADWKGQYISGVSLACGVAGKQGYADMDSLVKEADRKMYENKRDYYSHRQA